MCSKDVKMSKIRYVILPSGMQRFMQEDKRREEDKPLRSPIKLCVRVLVHIRNTRMLIFFFLRVCVCVYMHIYILKNKWCACLSQCVRPIVFILFCAPPDLHITVPPSLLPSLPPSLPPLSSLSLSGVCVCVCVCVCTTARF